VGWEMKIFVILWGLFFANNLIAEQILVVTDEWEGYTSKDGKGYYLELLQQIYNRPADELKFLVVPYARSLAMVKAGKADIVLGIYRGEIPDKHLASYVVEQDLVDILVSVETAREWQGMKTLEGKVVLAKIGYGFDDITDVKMKYLEVSSLKGMIKMLSMGRAAGVLDYQADLEPLMQEIGLDKNGYQIITSALSSPIYFGFADNDRSQELKKRFDQRFKEMYNSGEIKRLMESNLGHSKGLTTELQSWD
jgi:ABC-type amino acid transport substrate-binding protein